MRTGLFVNEDRTCPRQLGCIFIETQTSPSMSSLSLVVTHFEEEIKVIAAA